MEENKNDIRICKICGKSNLENKFQKNRRKCISCCSKEANQKLLAKNPEYFRKYMKDHYISNGNKRGRPKKDVNTSDFQLSNILDDIVYQEN